MMSQDRFGFQFNSSDVSANETVVCGNNNNNNNMENVQNVNPIDSGIEHRDVTVGDETKTSSDCDNMDDEDIDIIAERIIANIISCVDEEIEKDTIVEKKNRDILEKIRVIPEKNRVIPEKNSGEDNNGTSQKMSGIRDGEQRIKHGEQRIKEKSVAQKNIVNKNIVIDESMVVEKNTIEESIVGSSIVTKNIEENIEENNKENIKENIEENIKENTEENIEENNEKNYLHVTRDTEDFMDVTEEDSSGNKHNSSSDVYNGSDNNQADVHGDVCGNEDNVNNNFDDEDDDSASVRIVRSSGDGMTRENSSERMDDDDCCSEFEASQNEVTESEIERQYMVSPSSSHTSASSQALFSSPLSPSMVSSHSSPRKRHFATTNSMRKALRIEKYLWFERLTTNAYPPQRGSTGAVGYDLRSAYNYLIPSNGRALVKTDLSLRFPAGTYGRLAPRSGLALKYNIDVGAGVIDPDYTGNVCALLINHGTTDFLVEKGDRIVQLICERAVFPILEDITISDDDGNIVVDIADTNECFTRRRGDKGERGSHGFGSSGMR